MKIILKTPDMNFKLPIILPASLIKFFIRFGGKMAKKYVTEEEALIYINSIDWDALSNAFDELKRYKGLELVNIQSHDGTYVRIII
ncbi:hypothetical protein ABG79_01485 [Caloramator mitchellensis]|uniref:Uncharacterized protein n=1 Tax=Caloramator mitchellensis TaxID=908809 RepID=A0A0R3JWL7_CALMK|nr:hypothetical protein [Caloramator mitchellensis]KRQ86733.1 hypothetical protein ABG79_01485 [Caloramator mitchellensis]